ncbi:MAG TPA: YtxH domain-containing protein [Verrucomicrobiae bacterium]|jgi:gas vesicle protein|nr:YtxH domain-containing protein [Verrucomicrobiae bacterium]
MSDNRNSNIGWFLAGLGLGTVAAILFAPKSGRETREAIVTGVDDGRKYLASLGRDAREQVGDWVNSGKRIVADKKRQVNSAIDAGREAIHDATAGKRS